MSGLGKYTYFDLSDTSSLFAKRTLNMGMTTPPFLRDTARLSLELASTSYDFEMDEWLDAGWTDVTIQVDDSLYSGVRRSQERIGIRQMIKNEWMTHLARSKASRTNPISQYRGAMRQKENCDTGKAVVMMKKDASTGRYVLAIGFTGTGKRLYDWVSNFRMKQEDGMHLGFLQLTEQFESNADKIEFPQTAGELGLPKLTLADVLEEAKRADSRFMIWLAGHSQGGAILQCWVYRRAGDGILMQNMLGYGFASPSVTLGGLTGNLSDYPIYHIINSDDVVPRIGAMIHIGRCRVLPATEILRQTCYQGKWDDDNFRGILHLMDGIRNSKDALVYGAGLFEAILDEPENLGVATALLNHFMPEMLISAVENKMEQVMHFFLRRLYRDYQLMAGEEMPREPVEDIRRRLDADMKYMGAANFTKLLLEALLTPHSLVNRDKSKGTTAYTYAVLRGFDTLHPSLWGSEVAPMWDKRLAQTPTLPEAVQPARRPVHNRYAGYSSQRLRKPVTRGNN